MKRLSDTSSVLTIRVGAGLARSLSREARRRHTTKSELVREILSSGLAGKSGASSLAQEARRQSLLVAERPSERETLKFLEHAADTRGWE